jgi:hypothetical protein
VTRRELHQNCQRDARASRVSRIEPLRSTFATLNATTLTWRKSGRTVTFLLRCPRAIPPIANRFVMDEFFEANGRRNPVGTAVAGGPPRRSVREELPHTAPPLGVTVKMTASLPAVGMPTKPRSFRRRVRSEPGCGVPFPRVIPFPPRTPPPGFRRCSTISQVLWDHLTSQARTCWTYGQRPSPTVPPERGNAWDLPVLAFGVSMHAQGLRLRRVIAQLTLARRDVLPSPHIDKVGTRNG